MEAALLSGVLKILGNKLVSLIASEFASVMGATKDLSELQHLFGEITSRLSALGDRATDNDPSFYWLKDLKDVAYDFDDLLNKVHLEAEKCKADFDGDKHVMANCFCAKPKSALSRFEMAHKIKKIKKRFAKIVKQRTDVNAIAKSLVDEHPVRHINKTVGEMSILVNIEETKVLGRDEVKHEIVSKLVEADTQEKISIVSIVGLGGSGKTTLAKYICQDSKIGEHFDATCWVHVSQEFKVEKLIGKLFESISDKKSEVQTLQHMSRTISEKLTGKKFLLVLDDVWNEDQHDWEQFEQHFSSGSPGSKILLTTRDAKVAEAVKSTDIVNLAFLSDDDSWKLFQQRSGWAEESLDSEFIEVGKGIVKKCAGVPLAIKSLAGALHGKREIKEWRTLRDSNLLTYLDIQDRVLGSLSLSYFHLPDDLKQCFVLCSIFPKGYGINKDHLISQWIAHGFVNPMNGGRQPEDIGSDYFDYLLKVSFLQDLVKNPITGQLTCKMHDLVHDLTRQILQDEIVLTPKNTTTDHNQRCRYLSLASYTEKVDRKLFNKVRALYVTGGSFATDKPIKKACCVRSVILEDINDTSVPLFVLKFEYLGYLRISRVMCRELPEAITGCWNLQALHIISCYEFAMLPESIGKLKKLVTLQLSGNRNLASLPQSIGDCRSLERLHLTDCWKFREIPDSICEVENLRVLNIVDCYSLRYLPSESFGMLRNLRTINLSECCSLEDLPSSLACDELHTLKLHQVTKLTMLPQCITSLSNLKHLDLGNCKKLVELPEGIGNLKRLAVLNLEGCHNLRGLPAGFGQLTRLQRMGLFVIGDSSEHARISELGNLDMISGVLEINGIKYVKDPDDAEKAYLKKKSGIQKLILNYLPRGEMQKLILNYLPRGNWSGIETEEEVDMEQELGVLNGLEPPYGIKELEIRNYQGVHLPCWMTKKRHSCNLDGKFKQTVDAPHFPHVTSMELDYFHNLKHLSGFEGFPSLKTLELSRFDALESIKAGPFPSLTELRISGMSRLLELSTTTTKFVGNFGWNQEVQCCFPRLSTLHIEDCPKLNVKPWFPASLESLTLVRSNEQLLFPGSSFCPVHPHGDESELLPACSNSNGASSIVGCNGLRQLPGSMRSLTSLQELEISSCKNLRQLPEGIQHLTSLRSLTIQACDALHQLPEVGLGGLTSLKGLAIYKCDALHRLPDQLGELRSLQTLHIWDLPALTCLPESMQRLPTLYRLWIRGCDALTVLPEWIGQLSALEWLYIQNCRGLTSLPRSIQRLTDLRQLDISGNPDLARRYKQGAGEDWHLISHIPIVDMDRNVRNGKDHVPSFC